MTTPEEQHADAVEAALEWRDDERRARMRDEVGPGEDVAPSVMQLVAERYGLTKVSPGRWYAEKGDDERGSIWA